MSLHIEQQRLAIAIRARRSRDFFIIARTNALLANADGREEAVRRAKAAFGAAFDGDGDRLVVVDDKGRTVQTEKLGIIIARKLLRGDYDEKGNYEIVEITGLYWHFVDLVWVFIFGCFYLI